MESLSNNGVLRVHSDYVRMTPWIGALWGGGVSGDRWICFLRTFASSNLPHQICAMKINLNKLHCTALHWQGPTKYFFLGSYIFSTRFFFFCENV